MLGLDELGELGRAGGRDHVEAALVMARVRADELGLADAELVTDEVGERLADRQVQVRRDLSELAVEVDEERPAGAAGAHDDGQVDRDRRRADAALRREDRDEPAGRVGGALERPRPMPTSRERWKRTSRASTRASSSRASNGLAMTSSAPASRNADPVLDVVGLADAQDGDRGQRRRAPDLAADVGRRLGSRDDVDDDELVVAGRGEDLGAVLDRGDGVPDAAEDAGDDAAGRRVGFEEQEAAGRHGDSVGWALEQVTNGSSGGELARR